MQTDVKKICVVGTGYIGMPTAAMFASRGFEVVGVDKNLSVVENLNKGEIVIEEPGLPELVRSVVRQGRLRASSTPEQADAFILSVGTPINDDKTADMRAVRGAAESIIPFIKKGDIVVLESTSPPNTVEGLVIPILERSGIDVRKELYIAHAPERVIPGFILKELVEDNRIVGGITPEASERVKALYSAFVEGEITITDATTAEMCKLMENTFRNVNIGLANELAKICESFGIDVWEAISIANRHPRVNIHQPGPGVGGHCIAVDPWFIVEKAPDKAKIIELSCRTNDSMPEHAASLAAELLGHQTVGKKAAMLGVTFKPDTDDTRESPIAHVIARLEGMGMTVVAHDPHVASTASLDEAVSGADILILGVHHKQFADLDFAAIKSKMNTPVILDTRNFWASKNLESLGFTYKILGNGKR